MDHGYSLHACMHACMRVQFRQALATQTERADDFGGEWSNAVYVDVVAIR